MPWNTSKKGGHPDEDKRHRLVLPLSEIDLQLYDKNALTAPEREFIESMIKPMG